MPLFSTISIRNRSFSPALFLAPMAGVTNSAFRRLLADFGGCGVIYTEMLSPKALLHEDLALSPFTRKRAEEGDVFYQLRLSGEEDIAAVVARLRLCDPAGIDINLGCPAPEIQKQASGAALFRDFERTKDVLMRMRAAWDGILSVKCRLGDDPYSWREGFLERLKMFEDVGVDMVTVHPRFSTEKLKRKARWHEFPWIAEHTNLPLVGNGDMCDASILDTHAEWFTPLSGLMLGRIVAVRPWAFREFAGLPEMAIDYSEVWDRLYRYTMEDFPPEKAIGRLKEFTGYYAKNFFFGHELYRLSQSAKTIDQLRTDTMVFLGKNPRVNERGGLSFV